VTEAFENPGHGFCDTAPAATVRPSGQGLQRPWLVLLGLVGPINLLMTLDRAAMTLSGPRIQQQFGFSLTEISAIIACVLWTYALLQVPAGALVSRFGARRMLFFGCLAWSMATIATPFAWSFGTFLIIRLAMGAGQSPDWSSSIVTIDNWFAPGRRARANSVLLGCLYLGSVVGGPLTTQITAHWSWKVSFFLYGTLGVVWSGLWYLLARDRPAQGLDAVRPPAPPAGRMRDGAGIMLRSVQFWAVGLHYMCLLTAQSFFQVLLPFYLMNARHLSYTSMGWLSALPWLVLYVAVFLSGGIADFILRRSRSVWLARTPMGIVGTLLCGGLIYVGSQLQGTMAMILVFSLALGFSSLSQISIWTSVQDLTRGRTGLVAGWTTFWGNAASGIAPIVMVGIQHITGSWTTALCLPLIAGILGAVCCALTHPERPIEMDKGP